VWLAAEGQPTSPAVLVDCGACADCVGYVRLAQRTAIRFDPNPPPPTHPPTHALAQAHTHPHFFSEKKKCTPFFETHRRFQTHPHPTQLFCA
jgi:hypothetical protein